MAFLDGFSFPHNVRLRAASSVPLPPLSSFRERATLSGPFSPFFRLLSCRSRNQRRLSLFSLFFFSRVLSEKKSGVGRFPPSFFFQAFTVRGAFFFPPPFLSSWPTGGGAGGLFPRNRRHGVHSPTPPLPPLPSARDEIGRGPERTSSSSPGRTRRKALLSFFPPPEESDRRFSLRPSKYSNAISAFSLFFFFFHERHKKWARRHYLPPEECWQ